jgi:hypothetical protein
MPSPINVSPKDSGVSRVGVRLRFAHPRPLRAPAVTLRLVELHPGRPHAAGVRNVHEVLYVIQAQSGVVALRACDVRD